MPGAISGTIAGVTPTPLGRAPVTVPRLEASFARTGTARDHVSVVLASGRSLEWSWPTRGDDLPHDLAHFAVESAFRLTCGFWGLLASGVDLAIVNRAAEHAAPAAGSGLDRVALGHLLQAEALVNVLAPAWNAPKVDDQKATGLVLGACARLHLPCPAHTDVATVGRARHLVRSFEQRWSAIDGSGRITVAFPLPEPAPEAPAAAAPRPERAAAPRATPAHT